MFLKDNINFHGFSYLEITFSMDFHLVTHINSNPNTP